MISSKETWELFLKYKTEHGHMTEHELKSWQQYIEKAMYLPVAESIAEGTLVLPTPVRKEVNKIGSSKKRVVYSYPEEFSRVLKLIAFLLHKYDSFFLESCIAFKEGGGAGTAIRRLSKDAGIRKMYCLKADISDYFNSMDVGILLEQMQFLKVEDERLFSLFERMLTMDDAIDYKTGNLLNLKRGAMAGIPVAPFFANVYLTKMDEYFDSANVPYFRYSDDILIFADTKEDLDDKQNVLNLFLEYYHLKSNPDKFGFFAPGEPVEFLGFKLMGHTIDLSDTTKLKIKGKIKRKAKALRRWCDGKDIPYERGAKGFLKAMNHKFYDSGESTEFSWSRWFFPYLTTDAGLKEIDEYMKEYVRFCVSGRHYKGNFRITYDKLKALGYRSLLHEWYEFKKQCLNP